MKEKLFEHIYPCPITGFFIHNDYRPDTTKGKVKKKRKYQEKKKAA